jgi:hypothetical protein
LAQVLLTEDDDMVKTFPPERANQPLRMPILPRGARRNGPVPNAHSPKPPGENFAVNRVTIPNQVFGRPSPATSFGNLPGHPFGSWIGRHAQPQDLASSM